MSDAPGGLAPRSIRGQGAGWLTRVVAVPGVQRVLARLPLMQTLVRREGEAMFDLVAGFVHSQVLLALVEFGTLERLAESPQTLAALAHHAAVPTDRMAVLMRAAVALGLVRRRRDGRFAATLRGSALTGVPGLTEMIRHHRVLYRDLQDPVAFFRGETETELARFWPYVFGQSGARDLALAERYSALMADSQMLVAEETLAAVRFDGISHLLDVGGGTGAFLVAVGRRWPNLRLTLLDLPAVAAAAQDGLAAAGLGDRVTVHPASFRDDPLPGGADAMSLVRVLYDHDDRTVRDLLRKVFAVLPAGGRLIVSEPMSGGDRPTRAGDAYFALYTMAMQTGKTRSPAEICGLLAECRFTAIRRHRTARPFVTSVVTARVPG